MDEQAMTIDQQIGQNLRQLRRWRGLSQGQLAQALGVTFQQIQKYEKGRNRIGGSRFVELARILHVPVEQFFKGMEPGCAPEAEQEWSASTVKLVRQIQALENPTVEKALQQLLQAIRG